jgi:hypothetical protein
MAIALRLGQCGELIDGRARTTIDRSPVLAHASRMSIARRLGISLLGLLAGSALGAGAGLLGGLAYTELAGTTDFEGASGYVVVAWLVCGLFIGAIGGTILGARWGRRM